MDNLIKFKKTLYNIVTLEDYALRHKYIYEALGLASTLGYPCGIKEGPVVFIELPTGQISWVIQPYDEDHDGHSTATKIKRVKNFIFNIDK
jgi:hypothetical protein